MSEKETMESPLSDEYVPEKEVKQEENDVSVLPDNPRYVHDNPREFKGRLGYACINSYLRKQKPSVFSARTCRLDTVEKKGMDYVKELVFMNIADLKTMIKWNEENGIKFMRISSDIFPFASHDKAGYNIDFAKEELAEVGELAKKFNQRLTMHPGQYNQLVSKTPKVVDNTIRELDYHAQMLDLMGLDQDSIMIIHMGGVYGDRDAALARFEEEYIKLPENIKRRLVLENDEYGYSVSDLLPICKKLGIPLVLDWHHHHINPGNITDLVSLLPEINKTWTDKGIKPKQHYSESRRGAVTSSERRAHSDRVEFLPPTTDDVDLMIEAKDKEQAVFHLYKKYGLGPVNDEVWIPADKNLETTETKGRKSVKSAKKKKEEEDLKLEDLEDVKPKRTRKRKTEEAKPQDLNSGIVTKEKISRKRVVTPKKEIVKLELEIKKETDEILTEVKFEGRVTRQRTKQQRD